MNHELSASAAILTGSLRPWLNDNRDEEKFRQLFNQDVRKTKDEAASYFNGLITAYKKSGIPIEREIIEEFSDLETTSNSPELEPAIVPIDLPNYFNKQTEFYYYLIRNEFLGTILYMHQLVNSMHMIDARYNILKVFKKITYILDQLKEVSNNDDITVFILTVLKINLYWLHQELERLFSTHIDFEILSESELIHLLNRNTNSSTEDQQIIMKCIERYKILREETLNAERAAEKFEAPNYALKTDIVFVARPSDFRVIGKSPILYEDINNVEAFSKLENELFLSKIIDENYDFINTKGNKNLMAAIYHILILKNYFRKNSYLHPQNFEPRHYREYLDSRYNVDTGQQFRKCTPDKIEKFKRKHHWIDNIPYCR